METGDVEGKRSATMARRRSATMPGRLRRTTTLAGKPKLPKRRRNLIRRSRASGRTSRPTSETQSHLPDVCLAVTSSLISSDARRSPG